MQVQKNDSHMGTHFTGDSHVMFSYRANFFYISYYMTVNTT